MKFDGESTAISMVPSYLRKIYKNFKKFKVGDRVKEKATGCKGRVYDVDKNYTFVKFDHPGSDLGFSNRFRSLVKLKKKKNTERSFKINDRVKDIDSGCKGAVTDFAGFSCNKLTHVDVKWDKGCAEQFVSVRDLVKLKKTITKITLAMN